MSQRVSVYAAPLVALVTVGSDSRRRKDDPGRVGRAYVVRILECGVDARRILRMPRMCCLSATAPPCHRTRTLQKPPPLFGGNHPSFGRHAAGPGRQTPLIVGGHRASPVSIHGVSLCGPSAPRSNNPLPEIVTIVAVWRSKTLARCLCPRTKETDYAEAVGGLGPRKDGDSGSRPRLYPTQLRAEREAYRWGWFLAGGDESKIQVLDEHQWRGRSDALYTSLPSPQVREDPPGLQNSG